MRFILPITYCSPLLLENTLGFITTTSQSDMVTIHYPIPGYTYYFQVRCNIEEMEDQLILIRPAILSSQQFSAAVLIEAKDDTVVVYPLPEFINVDTETVDLTKNHLFH